MNQRYGIWDVRGREALALASVVGVSRAAEMLNVGQTTIYRWRKCGVHSQKHDAGNEGRQGAGSARS